MLEAGIIVAVYAAVFWLDFLPLLKNKKANEIWVYGCMMVISLIVVLLICFNVKIPSPFFY